MMSDERDRVISGYRSRATGPKERTIKDALRERDEALAREAVLAEALGWIRDHCNTFSDNCNAAGMRGTAKVALASLSDRAKQMLAAIEALRIIARNTKAGVVNVWWVKDFADKAVRVMKETT